MMAVVWKVPCSLVGHTSARGASSGLENHLKKLRTSGNLEGCLVKSWTVEWICGKGTYRYNYNAEAKAASGTLECRLKPTFACVHAFGNTMDRPKRIQQSPMPIHTWMRLGRNYTRSYLSCRAPEAVGPFDVLWGQEHVHLYDVQLVRGSLTRVGGG